MKILIVDDEALSLSSVKRVLKWKGIKNVETCDNGRTAIERIRRENFDIVLLDLLMPDVDGMQVLESTKPFCPETEFIILTAVDDIQTTVRAMRQGAYDYLVKPVDNELLFLSIERAYERKGLLAGLSISASRETADIPPAFADTITQDKQMKALISYAQVMARSGNPILITGESGTGKELMARGIHRAGPAPAGPFVPVNVSAIPATMFESQIFGHVKGAFTGAESPHSGFFEQADGGTLFLDEIGEMPLDLQPHLLRVLETGDVYRIGENRPRRVTLRLIAATNRDLREEVRAGRFRMDLFYRIAVTTLSLPPLRDRADDLEALARHLLRDIARRYDCPVPDIDPAALAALTRHDWPGNIRELRNALEAMMLESGGGRITLAHRPPDLFGPAPQGSAFAPGTPPDTEAEAEDPAGRISPLEKAEREAILDAIRRHRGNLTGVARELGIAKSTLYTRLDRFALKDSVARLRL